ncbi:MAG: RluA family pseudouridine synthase [Desulfotalea sp.]
MIIKPVEIIYKDEFLVVARKPGGLLSVPGKGPENADCVSSRLQELFPKMIAQPAIHRLDMYTSGLMVYAIDKATHRNISIQFQDKLVTKRYTALLEKDIDGEEGEIRLPFRLDIDNRPLQILDYEHGKMGITKWRKINSTKDITRIEFTPITGRTHQLRVHAAHEKGLGAAIIGDSFYGSGANGDEMMLHANFLQFSHPITNEMLEFSSSSDF